MLQKFLRFGNFACDEYSHAQPLVSELPDGFGGECEPERLRYIANAMPIPWAESAKREEAHLAMCFFSFW